MRGSMWWVVVVGVARLVAGGDQACPASNASGDALGPELTPIWVDLPSVTSASTPATASAGAAAAIGRACRAHGVFQVPHGLDKAGLSHVWDAHDGLFQGVSPASKASTSLSREGFSRGYVPFGGESGSPEVFECKEGFSYGFPWPMNKKPENALQGPNVWPEEARGGRFQASLDAFFAHCLSIIDAVLAPMAADTGVDLPGLCRGGETISLVRLFRYLSAGDPACSPAGDRDTSETSGTDGARVVMGSSPHTDWGLLTLILDRGESGLEVRLNGTWHRVATDPRAMTVVCGDYLSLLTDSAPGGPYHSPVHQVQLADTGRSSFVFFHYPRHDAQLSSLGAAAVEAAAKRFRDEASSAAAGSRAPQSASAPRDTVGEESAATTGLDTVKGDGDVNAVSPRPNTMIDMAAQDPTLVQVPFGEYLSRKWRGVRSA